VTQPLGFPPPPAQPDPVARLQAEVAKLRTLAFGGLAVGLVATALAGFALMRTPQAAVVQAVPGQSSPAQAAATASEPIGKPADAGAAPSGTIILGTPNQGHPVLDIYEDFQCPACAQVEKTFGPQVDALIASGQVEVRYHAMSFLDGMLRNDSSVRAANGGFCANEQGRFPAWHDTLFALANRPPREGDGWTDAQLTAFAQQSGLDVTAWSTCVASKKYAGAVSDANQLSIAAGVNATPTYKLNGTSLNLNAVAAAGGLVKFVEANR